MGRAALDGRRLDPLEDWIAEMSIRPQEGAACLRRHIGNVRRRGPGRLGFCHEKTLPVVLLRCQAEDPPLQMHVHGGACPPRIDTLTGAL